MTDLKSFGERIVDNLQQVILGKSQSVELVVIGLLCQGHVLIEDVPGVGKTTLALGLAKSVGCSFQVLLRQSMTRGSSIVTEAPVRTSLPAVSHGPGIARFAPAVVRIKKACKLLIYVEQPLAQLPSRSTPGHLGFRVDVANIEQHHGGQGTLHRPQRLQVVGVVRVPG